MIVYCNSIWLENTTALGDIFSTFTYWVHSKTKDPIFADTFLNQPKRIFNDGSMLEIFKTDSNYPNIFSFRYSQKDNSVPGRSWISEIGIKQDSTDSDIQCSFLVQTIENSVNVPAPKQTTRPWLIVQLLKRCKPSIKTVGIRIKTIDDLSDAEALAYEIDSSERKHPIILVSPNPEGEYLVNLDKLLFQISGLAEIIQIPVGADAIRIARILGKPRSAYNGAINILFPLIQRNGSSFVPTRLLMSESIEEIKSQGIEFESEILTSVTHRMNLPNYWIHISPDMVKEAQRKRELEKLRQHSKETGDLKQYVELLECDNQQKQAEVEDLQLDIASLKDDNIYYVNEYDKADNERKSLVFKVDNLRNQLESLKNTRQQRGELQDCSEELRLMIEEYFAESITPSRSLELISRIYPDRIIILDSAYRSAKNSQGFFEKKIVFDLLWKLSTDYWQALNDGKGDTEAKQIFGKNFSPESETVEKNNESRRRRTFTYNGIDLEMMKHLKHGVKNSAAETIRIHFEWLSDERKIIIGHCGPHLDFN